MHFITARIEQMTVAALKEGLLDLERRELDDGSVLVYEMLQDALKFDMDVKRPPSEIAVVKRSVEREGTLILFAMNSRFILAWFMFIIPI